jgi:hypothetical protein
VLQGSAVTRGQNCNHKWICAVLSVIGTSCLDIRIPGGGSRSSELAPKSKYNRITIKIAYPATLGPLLGACELSVVFVCEMPLLFATRLPPLQS